MPSPSPLPTIILISGAWHSPSHFHSLLTTLISHAYKTIPIWLPSMHYSWLNPPLDPAKVDLLDDIAAIRAAVVQELTHSPTTDVVLLAHSYGSVPASSAVENLDKCSREAEGHKNGIRALLIMTGLIIPSGITAMEWAGNQIPPTVHLSSIPDPNDSIKEIQISQPVADPGPIALFYHDIPDQEDAKRYASLCTPQIWAVNTTVIPFSGWKLPHLEVHYLVCEDDRALPAGFQRGMIENANRERGVVVERGKSGEEVGSLLGRFPKDSLVDIGNDENSTARKGENEAVNPRKEEGGVKASGGSSSAEIRVTSIESGHSPFISNVQKTADWVRRACGEEF